MTWKSHGAIALSFTLPFNPVAIFPATIGATAPDWLEYIIKAVGFDIEHRGITHLWIVGLIFILISFLWDYNGFLFWFGIGYLSHLFADAMTITGVPCIVLNHRIHFFNSPFTTGHAGEYIFSFTMLGLSILIFGVGSLGEMLDNRHQELPSKNKDFKVYQMSYKELYENGIIDQKEYLERRFKFF